MNDKDENLKPSIDTKCSCHDCNNEAETFLEVVRIPTSGYYCQHCAIDIKLHAIAEEVIFK